MEGVNMALTFGFFDSVNGDRKYSADDISNYFLKLISNGVFATPSNAMQVQESSGMTVQVSAGWAFINCKWLNNSAPYLLTCDAADVALDRIDRVVLKLDPTVAARSISMYIKKGTPSASAEAPALTRVQGGAWELSLAQISITAGATAITDADITDERGDTSVCGYVTGLIDQIDTTNLFAQFQSAFNNWFAAVRSEIASATLIVPLRATYLIDDEQTTDINISDLIPQYNYNLDVLNIYVNGLKLIEGRDFVQTHNAGGETTIAFQSFDLDVLGTPVEIEVLKGNDTTNAETVVHQVQNALTQLNGLSFQKLSQAQYDIMPAHDPNTLYIINAEV